MGRKRAWGGAWKPRRCHSVAWSEHAAASGWHRSTFPRPSLPSVADWVGKASFHLRPVVERLGEHLKQSGKPFMYRGEGLVGGDGGTAGSHGRSRRCRRGKIRVLRPAGAAAQPRREDWALRMLRSAHVLKGAGRVDWKTFAGTAKAVLDSWALETVPIMEYVWERTNRVLAKEELLRGRE